MQKIKNNNKFAKARQPKTTTADLPCEKGKRDKSLLDVRHCLTFVMRLVDSLNAASLSG